MRRARLLLLAVVALAGCGDIIGLDGYTDADGSIVADTGTDVTTDAKASDVVSDVTKDGGGSDAPADGACPSPAFACVPALPTGWAWAGYDPDTRPACATGYGTPLDVEEGIDASTSCACGCNITAPSCTANNLTITAGNNVGCNSTTNQTDPSTSGCDTPTSFTSSTISVTGGAPSGGSCTPDGGTTVPPVGYGHQGRTCSYPGDAGGGCSSGNVCLPSPAPFTMCIAQVGTNACPSGFPNQHLVGSAISDTRGCTACGCTFDAGACTGTATFYRDTACSMGAAPVPVTGTCTGVGNHTWVRYTYTPTSNAGCAPSAVAPDGGVVFTDLTTVCCE